MPVQKGLGGAQNKIGWEERKRKRKRKGIENSKSRLSMVKDGVERNFPRKGTERRRKKKRTHSITSLNTFETGSGQREGESTKKTTKKKKKRWGKTGTDGNFFSDEQTRDPQKRKPTFEGIDQTGNGKKYLPPGTRKYQEKSSLTIKQQLERARNHGEKGHGDEKRREEVRKGPGQHHKKIKRSMTGEKAQGAVKKQGGAASRGTHTPTGLAWWSKLIGRRD